MIRSAVVVKVKICGLINNIHAICEVHLPDYSYLKLSNDFFEELWVKRIDENEYCLHRLDGPALVSRHTYTKKYYIDGVEYLDYDRFNEEVQRLKVLKEKSIESGLNLTY